MVFYCHMYPCRYNEKLCVVYYLGSTRVAMCLALTKLQKYLSPAAHGSRLSIHSFRSPPLFSALHLALGGTVPLVVSVSWMSLRSVVGILRSSDHGGWVLRLVHARGFHHKCRSSPRSILSTCSPQTTPVKTPRSSSFKLLNIAHITCA